MSTSDDLSPGPLSLEAYNAKRDFDETTEPPGETLITGQSRFVIQKHLATRTHFDLRLEHEGRLLSWAITKGPSLNPADKRLAVRTEDHPVAYIDYEGIIPEGYGKGRMIVWDAGDYEAVIPIETGLPKGEIKFVLHGHRLQGQFALVRLKEKTRSARENWLLVKDRDAYATDRFDPAALFTRSLITGQAPEALTEAGKPLGSLPLFNEDGPLPFALAENISEPPTGDDWVHEIKYDGYRVQVDMRDGLRLLTRKGLDWTARYPGVAEQLADLSEDCVLDGEIVADGPDGRPTFSALRKDLEEGGHKTRVMLFDVLIADGRDVRGEPLLARRLILRNLLAGFAPHCLVDFLAEDGPTVLEQVGRLGLEGIVSKRRSSPYPKGRSSDWRKTKLAHVDGFLIGGYRRSTTRGRPFASLLLGSRAVDGSLTFRGRVGSGFSDRDLREMAARLKPLEQNDMPFADVPGLVRRDAVWVLPELGAQVEYAGLTGGDQVRHARFLGLREDVEAFSSAQVEVALPTPVVRVTSADTVIDEQSGRTKRDVVAYYEAISGVLSEGVMPRPLTVLRAPDGTDGETFFQRNASHHLPKGVRAMRGLSALAVEDPLSFARLAQNRMIELHMMGSTLAKPERPDRLVFDLDPDEGLAWDTVESAARLVKAILEAAGLAPAPLLTGGKGVHLVCHINSGPDWPTFAAVAKGLASDIAAAEPKLFTASQSISKRKGRIYLDWMRNRRGSTAIAPWSLRARPGLPVAQPATWDNLPPPGRETLTLERAAALACVVEVDRTALSKALLDRYREL